MNILRLISFIIVYTGFCFAQNNEWINYSYGGVTSGVVVENNLIWVGTEGGLAKINKNTDELIIYNHANSLLPGNKITSLAIGTDGTKWIGTYYGLLRIINENWELFDTSNSGLPGNIVNTLRIDKQNNLWIGTENGAAVFDGDKFTVFNTSNSGLLGNFVLVIETGVENSIWIATKHYGIENIEHPGGIVKYQNGNWTQYISLKDNTPDLSFVRSMKFNNGILWIASTFVHSFDGTTWTSYNDNINSPYLGGATSIDTDKSGNIWIAMNFGGLVKFDGSSWISYMADNSGIVSDQVCLVAIDSAGIIYAGGYKGTLDIYDGEKWKSYATHHHFLLSHSISDFAVDSSNSVWIGTRGGGLSVIKKNGNSLYNAMNSQIKDNFITSLSVDSRNALWVGTTMLGAGKFDGFTWDRSINSVLPSSRVIMITSDSKNNIWVSCTGVAPWWNGGFVKVSDDKTEVYKISQLVPTYNDQVTSIVYDKNDILWIGVGTDYNGGIVSYDGFEWKSFRNSGIQQQSVTSLEVDDLNRKWIGTYSDGIGVFDDFVWDYHFLGTQVRALEKDLNGNIWAGLDKGLAKYDGKNWITYNRSNSGLPENNITSVVVDKLNNIWVGTTGSGVAVLVNNPILTSVSGKNEADKPENYLLNHNYPNPFNPSTTISYYIPKTEFVTLRIYSLLGDEVVTLVNSDQSEGEHEVKFDADNLSSGIYLYRLTAGNFVSTKKLILIK